MYYYINVSNMDQVCFIQFKLITKDHAMNSYKLTSSHHNLKSLFKNLCIQRLDNMDYIW